jgi:5-methyltetrahydropteroyltriglutamate--homocysteine methyltransferase
MAIETTVIGAYPKPPNEGDTFSLRKTLHALERGDANEADVQKALEELTTQMIREQEEAGIDLITDGHAGWEDILTPFAKKMAGFEIGGLLRWFDNNVYYRRPVCVGDIEWRGPVSVDGYRFAASVAARPVKAVIPGPVTFAHLSVDEHYGDHKELTLAIARVLAQEAFELEAAGASVIQIDEPALLEHPEDLDLAAEAIYIITSQLKSAETVLATYFGDAKRLGPQLFELPVKGFGLDLVAGPENFHLVKEIPPEKHLQAGIVNARNTKLEDLEELKIMVFALLDDVTHEQLRIAPSCSLEFLPREKARAKLKLLAEVAREVGDRS